MASLNTDTFVAHIEEASKEAGDRGLVSANHGIGVVATVDTDLKYRPDIELDFFDVNSFYFPQSKELVTTDADRILEISDYTHRTDNSLGMVFVKIRMPLRAVNGDLRLQRYVHLTIVAMSVGISAQPA